MSENTVYKVEDDTTLDLTAGRIRKAAEDGCSDVRNALKSLFPEVFERSDVLNLKWEAGRGADGNVTDADTGSPMIWLRSRGDYANQAFQLDEDFNWEVTQDSMGYLILVPRKKTEEE